MASYFDEHGCEPHINEEDLSSNLYISLARMLQDIGFESQVMSFLNSDDRKPPASKQFIENLKKCHDFKETEKCCICLKNFVANETVKVDCGHKFHVQCITPWLQMHNSCPLCRTEFPTDDEEYERNKKERIRKETTLEELHNSMFT